MASRIFWILMAGAALVAGMAVQDGGSMFRFGDGNDRSVHRSIEARVNRAIDHSVTVTDSDDREMDISPEAKRALMHAVGQLVKAETRLALVRVGDETPEDVAAATAARDHARAELDRLKAEFKQQEKASVTRHVTRDQIRDEVRDNVRETVRDAVRR